MRIKKMNWFVKLITLNLVDGITLAPFGIYLKEGYLHNAIFINHEKVHWKQQIELLVVLFYIWYVIEFLIMLLVKGDGAYNSISFEREAYDNETDMYYLKIRKPFSWLKYFKLNS